jgi:hypothetical protein
MFKYKPLRRRLSWEKVRAGNGGQRSEVRDQRPEVRDRRPEERRKKDTFNFQEGTLSVFMFPIFHAAYKDINCWSEATSFLDVES